MRERDISKTFSFTRRLPNIGGDESHGLFNKVGIASILQAQER